MTVRCRRIGCLVAFLFVGVVLATSPASAQPAIQPAAGQTESSIPRTWLVAGGAFATVRADCQTCEKETPYRHGGSVLVNAGYRVNTRMDVGGEVFWIPVSSANGHVRVTHIDAVAQFRPWHSRGFFLKGGAGMAFVRNWVDAVGPDPVNSKALSVAIGGGWEFRAASRVGFQLFAAQHVAALGDVKTVDTDVPDVVGNFWSIGAALVFR